MLKAPFNNFDTFLFDGDGVLYKEDEPLPDVLKTLSTLKKMGKKIYILTNNSSKTRDEFQLKLKKIGVLIPKENILTSAYLTAQEIASENPQANVYVIGEYGLKEELSNAGLNVVNNWEEGNEEEIFDFNFSDIDYVITGMDRKLTYVKIARAMNILKNKNVRFIGTNADITFPTPNGYIPGGGAMIAILEQLSNRKIDRIIGKPNPLMYEVAEKLSETRIDKIVMIGDRLETDILGANRVGIKSCLVLTGVSTLEDVSNSDEELQPDIIISQLSDILVG